jgi:hypothetical protein
MNESKSRFLVFVVVSLLLGVEFHTIAVCSFDGIGVSEVPPSVPIGVELSLSPVPRLNEVGELRCVVTSVFKASDVRVEVKLPDGFALVSGDLTWQGDLTADGKVEVIANIKTVKLGSWVIEGEAGYSFTGGMYLDRDRLYITVTEASAYMSREPLSATTSPSAIKVDPSQASARLPLPPQGIAPQPPEAVQGMGGAAQSPGSLTVTGIFYCYISEDTPRLGSMRSDELQRMVWGWAIVYRASDYAYLGDQVTGTDGSFSIAVENPASNGFYVEMVPWTTAAHVVKSDESEYGSYTIIYYPSPSDTVKDIGGWAPPDDVNYKAAWRAYETIVNDAYDRGGWDFMVNEGPGFTPPRVKVRIPMPSGHGTHIHLDPTLSTIDIDNVDYSRALDTLLHEYGHEIMYRAYSNWFPTTYCPSPHYIEGASHVNCAWTEGWPDFFPLACQMWGRDGSPYDPYYEWGTGSYRNLETQTWGTSGWDDGPAVEGRVAGALLDIYDYQNDGHDQWQRTHSPAYHKFSEIWDTLRNGGHHSNFHEYLQAWQTRGHLVSSPLAGCLWQNTIEYGDLCALWSTLPGASTQAPFPAVFNDRLYVFVRGASSTALYYRYMDSGGTWTPWSTLPGASTHCPTAAVFNNRLYVFVKAANSNGLYYGYFTTGGSWNGWYALPGFSTQAPLPVAFNNRLYVFVKAASSNSLYYQYMDSGGTWTGWSLLPGTSTHCPTAAVFNNRLYVFVKAANSNGLYYGYFTTGGSWNGWYALPGFSTQAPLPVTSGSHLYVFVRGASSYNLYYRYMDTADSWRDWSMLSGTSTHCPTAAVFNNRLDVFVKGASSNSLYYR